MSVIVQRVFYHVVGRPFLRGLVLPLLVALLAISFLDANSDWDALRRQLALLAPWQQAVLFCGLISTWSWKAGRVLRPVWRQPMIAFLVRQPVNRWQWAVGLMPSLCIAFVPVAAIWWLAPHRANGLIHYLGFVGLAWPIILGASYAGARSVVLIAAGTVSLAALIFGYSYYSFIAYVALLVTIVQLPLAVALIPCQVAQVNKEINGDLAGSGVIATLVRRDLRCLVRIGRKGLLNLAALSAIAALMMWAFRVNGGVEGRDAFITACILFSVAASTVYESLEKIKVGLGEEIMRRRWPVTYEQRALSLAGVIFALAGPAAFLVALTGSTMGSSNLVLFVMFVALTIVSCSALYAGLLRTKRSAIGLSYLLVALHALTVLVLPAWGYALLALAAIPIGFLLTTRGFREFTARVQRIALDQPA